MAAHFNKPDHSLEDLRVMVIEKLHRNDPLLKEDQGVSLDYVTTSSCTLWDKPEERSLVDHMYITS